VGTRPPPVALRFPTNTRNVIEPALRELSDTLIERRIIETSGGLTGTRIEIVGLHATITDVLVRVQMSDGHLFNHAGTAVKAVYRDRNLAQRRSSASRKRFDPPAKLRTYRETALRRH
jgi:hypothetical protein